MSAGTCNVNHAVTVKLTEPNSGTFREQTAQASAGKWETTYDDYPAGTYKITAICGNMAAPIELDNVKVE